MKVGEVQEVWCKKLEVASGKRLFVLKRVAVAAHGSVEEGDAKWPLPYTLEIPCNYPNIVLLPVLESMESKRNTSHRSYSTNVYIQNH